jgi:hypothetical protein
MTDTTRSAGTAGTRTRTTRRDAGPTGWVGWIVYAGTMMVLLGSFHFLQGLVALFNDEYYLVAQSGLVVELDYTAWGWTHLLLGTLIVVAGVALMAGKTWARAVAVVLAVISSIVNVTFLAAYPVWSAMMIVFNVLVIWAVTVHGREIERL